MAKRSISNPTKKDKKFRARARTVPGRWVNLTSTRITGTRKERKAKIEAQQLRGFYEERPASPVRVIMKDGVTVR